MIKLKNFGLSNTNFESPHGLDSNNHYTTAYELATLANYAMKNDVFSNIVNTKSYTVNINNEPKSINNTNELLGFLAGVYGVKTGFTNGANRCLVSACKRNSMDIICVVLGADTKKFRTSDSINLINYTFENFEPVNIKNKINNEFNNWLENNRNYFYVEKGLKNSLELDIANLAYDIITIKKENIKDIRVEINCKHVVTAPLNKNSIVGNIDVKAGNLILASCDIVTSQNIRNKNILNYFFNFIKNYKLYIKNSI